MRTLLFIISLLLLHSAGAQQADLRAEDHPRKQYIAWVMLKEKVLTGQPGMIKGSLAGIRESELLVTPVRGIMPYSFEFEGIESIKLRRKNKVGRGLGIGAAAGLVIGAIVGGTRGHEESENTFSGYPATKELTTGTFVVVSATGGALLGGTLGALIGSSRKHYSIRGDRQRWAAFRVEVLDR